MFFTAQWNFQMFRLKVNCCYVKGELRDFSTWTLLAHCFGPGSDKCGYIVFGLLGPALSDKVSAVRSNRNIILSDCYYKYTHTHIMKRIPTKTFYIFLEIFLYICLIQSPCYCVLGSKSWEDLGQGNFTFSFKLFQEENG